MDTLTIETSQCEPLAEVLARAFDDDPLCCYIFPEQASRQRLLRWIFARWTQLVARRNDAYTTVDLAGAALWNPPELGLLPSLLEQLRAGLWQTPFKMSLRELGRGLKAHVDGAAHLHRNINTPHWVLDLLGVDPKRQGQGVMRVLLRPVLEQADAAQQPCYVITNKPENVLIYGRFGFETVDEKRLHGTPVMVYGLRRPPNHGRQ